ncbi:hypothetical protein [Nocardia brasiliensis]|uniref:hypothetical protein n=1 Tax=Nocardia brasiliensis TaxID=37326 RepID=UPI0024555E95|nr:hypothetical protein [Nocardia brasiliensis]
MTTPRKTVAKRATPHKPAGVREPQDHKTPAAQREAEAVELAVVEWEGLTFEIVADPDEWDFWTVITPLSANNVPQAIIGLLGPKQTSLLQRAKPRMKGPEARELFDKISEAVGFGNSGN